MDRQQGDRGGQPQSGRGAGKLRQHRQRRGVDAQQVEMMLADPGRVQPDLLGPQCLGIDVLEEVLRRPLIARIAVVAQREIAELHDRLPGEGMVRPECYICKCNYHLLPRHSGLVTSRCDGGGVGVIADGGGVSTRRKSWTFVSTHPLRRRLRRHLPRAKRGGGEEEYSA